MEKKKNVGEPMVLKGTKEYVHHLFKLKEAKMKRNTSWKYKEPSVILLEHAHIYHSLNDTTFQEQKHSSATGGHFHEVTIETAKDEEGRDIILSKKCGPPLQIVVVKAGTRTFKKVVPVTFEQYSEMGGDIVDDHRHEVEYIDSEYLTQSSRNAHRAEERAKVHSAMRGQPISTQPGAAAKLQQGASAAAPLVKE